MPLTEGGTDTEGVVRSLLTNLEQGRCVSIFPPHPSPAATPSPPCGEGISFNGKRLFIVEARVMQKKAFPTCGEGGPRRGPDEADDRQAPLWPFGPPHSLSPATPSPPCGEGVFFSPLALRVGVSPAADSLWTPSLAYSVGTGPAGGIFSASMGNTNRCGTFRSGFVCVL